MDRNGRIANRLTRGGRQWQTRRKPVTQSYEAKPRSHAISQSSRHSHYRGGCVSKRTLTLAATAIAIGVAACSSYGTSVIEVKKTAARFAPAALTASPGTASD